MRSAWHISPLADAAFYHFSWAPAVLMCLGLRWHFGAQANVIILLLWPIATHIHRWYTFPYAYLDGEIFARSKVKLLVFPGVLLLLLLTFPWLLGLIVRHAGISVFVFMTGLIAVRGVWDGWHSIMQKFGIMRMYNGKGKAVTGAEVPRWVDWWLLISWYMLIGVKYLSYGAPTLGVVRYATVGPFSMRAILGWVSRHQSGLVVPPALFVLVVIASWLWHEHRAFRFQNRARISLMVGQSLFMITLLIVDPVIAIAAGAINHAVEYIAFVAQTQRKRYATESGRTLWLARITGKPLPAVGLYLIIPLFFFYLQWVSSHRQLALVAGISISIWVAFALSVESFIHYYVDGVIWKLRKPEYRASLN